MQSRWLQILQCGTRPERSALARCLEMREQFMIERRVIDEARARAIAACEARIHDGRVAVFAAGDGVVPVSMTELEREWRRLSRRDPDEHLMDLWALVAPPRWHDRKRWRDGAAGTRADLALALAADVAGVDAAEKAAEKLCGALGAWGANIGDRIAFRFFTGDGDATSEWLAAPLDAARERLAARGDERLAAARMSAVAQEILEAASQAWPERQRFSASIAHAALVGGMLAEACLVTLPDPVEPLCELWSTGYWPAVIDGSGIVLELPPL